jgi:hypothetical protein
MEAGQKGKKIGTGGWWAGLNKKGWRVVKADGIIQL